MTDKDLKELLDAEAMRINNPDFIAEDPVQFPRRFSEKRDIEIAALLSSTIAWGKRSMIFLDGSDDSPGGVSGNGSGGGRFTVSDGACIGVDFHDHILHTAYGAQGRLEGDPQGHGNPAQFYFCDFHIFFPFIFKFISINANANQELNAFP